MRGRWLWIAAVVVFTDVIAGIWWFRNWQQSRHDSAILSAAVRYQVEPALVKAVVWRESGFKAEVRGKAGELGLMQIREPAAREWAVAEKIAGFQFEHLLDSGTNTLAGTWYLARLTRRYSHTDNPAAYALADYNAGRSHVLQWNKDGAATNSSAFLAGMTFPGTKRYVLTVQQRREIYRAQKFGLEH
ncbi:MAG: lytic transglycosylase domain-containing protein [Pedosphaera sp.]|nr:lytic transglycosylase domain-containing protein [Pedosphaera sp.]